MFPHQKCCVSSFSNLKYTWPALCLLLFFVCRQTNAQRKNNFFIGYSVYEEFSTDRRVSATLNPDFADIGKPQQGSTKKFSIPYSIFFQYQRLTERRLDYTVFFSWYFHTTNRTGITGASYRKDHISLAANIGHPFAILLKNHLVLRWYSGGVTRYGMDYYWINQMSDLSPYRKLIDLGIQSGIMMNIYLPLGFTFNASIGFTKWFFLHSNVFQRSELNYGYHPLKPGNQLDMSLGIGYTFGKKINPAFTKSMH